MKKVTEAGDLKGKRIFVRLDLNVPVAGGKVANDFRIKRALPTIEYLQKEGAKIILASHFEGEGGSLAPVCEYLGGIYPDCLFVRDYYPAVPREIEDALAKGEIVLLENLRKYEGEKANDEDFAKALAGIADVYVNDAFPSSHRAHASIVGIPKFIPGFAGLAFAEEIENLKQALSPEKPFLFVLGGAKFETKLPLVEKFLHIADKIFIGGALANDALAAKGLNVGKSLVSESKPDLSFIENEKFILPIDVAVKTGESVSIKRVEDVADEDVILDVGPASLAGLGSQIKDFKFILWNGPLGNYEKGFTEGTTALAKIISESGAKSVVGGGDTIASIEALGIMDRFTFISAGGGAMLDFLANETLPGIEALG